MTKQIFLPDDTDFYNPERGPFIQTSLTSDEGSYSWVRRDYSVNIVRANVRLDAYRLIPIPQAKLDEYDGQFDALRTQGLGCILQFQYNNGSADDASKAQILAHIDQLEYLLVKHQDIIICMNVGFIGWWGEWHNSTNGLENTTDRTDILFALLSALPINRMACIRTPFWKWDIFGDVLDAARAFNGSNLARTGHQNDGLWSVNWGYPQGTYPHDEPSQQWFDNLFAEGPYTASTGESSWFGAGHLVSCPNADYWLSNGNWNHMNELWHPDVITELTSEGCWDDILKYLGYRFVLEEAILPRRAPPGKDLSFQIKFRNDGYGSLYNPRTTFLVLRNDANRYDLEIENLDPRWWNPGNNTLENFVTIPADIVEGDYEISLWLPDAYASIRDDAQYAVRFANQGTWDAARGTNVLGQITIGTLPSGEANPIPQTILRRMRRRALARRGL